MTWLEIFNIIGIIFGIALTFFMVKEFIKIFREKDDYNDSVNLPD